MKDSKNISIIIVTVILLSLGLIAFFVISKNQQYGYLLFSNITSYKCSRTSCEQIENAKIDEDSKKGEFHVYEYNNDIGYYNVEYINRWNFFDKSSNWVNIANTYIAGSKDVELKEQSFETREMNQSELEILNKLLKEKKINSYNTLIQNTVLEYDFNKDRKKEKIIIASNASDETEDEQLFSIVIGIINNRSSILNIDIFAKGENEKVPSYNIKGIINIFNFNEDYLVLLKGYYSEEEKPQIVTYKLKKNKFVNLIK